MLQTEGLRFRSGYDILAAVKDVLAIAYHYPPIASPGAERMRAFARDLPEHGYRLLPVTTSTYGREGAEDVVRVGEPVGLFRTILNPEQKMASPEVRSRIRTDAGGLSGIATFIRDRISIPDGQIAWCLPALLACLREIRRRDVRVLYTSSPPNSVHLLGSMVKGLTGLPWVAEFRDTWTHDPIDAFLSQGGWRLRLEASMERHVAIGADRVVGVTNRACDFLETLAGAGKVRCVPNGFAEDLSFVEDEVGSDGPLHIVHVGSFSESHQRRSPDVLVKAVASLGDAVRLSLVGPLTEEEKDRVRRLGAGCVETVGMVPRDEALQWQRDSDAVVLVDHSRSYPSTNVPSKCYEYLASGRSILALTPEGATRDLLKEVGGGICVDPDDEPGITSALGRLIEVKRRGKLREFAARDGTMERYCRKGLAGELAKVFDEMAEG